MLSKRENNLNKYWFHSTGVAYLSCSFDFIQEECKKIYECSLTAVQIYAKYNSGRHACMIVDNLLACVLVSSLLVLRGVVRTEVRCGRHG